MNVVKDAWCISYPLFLDERVVHWIDKVLQPAQLIPLSIHVVLYVGVISYLLRSEVLGFVSLPIELRMRNLVTVALGGVLVCFVYIGGMLMIAWFVRGFAVAG